jgi:hypothetical protein
MVCGGRTVAHRGEIKPVIEQVTNHGLKGDILMVISTAIVRNQRGAAMPRLVYGAVKETWLEYGPWTPLLS